MLQYDNDDRRSLDRPAWTSEYETGLWEAFNHKHTIVRGRFKVLRNYYGNYRAS